MTARLLPEADFVPAGIPINEPSESGIKSRPVRALPHLAPHVGQRGNGSWAKTCCAKIRRVMEVDPA